MRPSMISFRRYNPIEVCAFMRTREAYGEFSNMAGGFPFRLAGLEIPSSEHYYQMMRYPHRPDLQMEILAVKSPMYAKRKAYEFIDETREDWKQINVNLMRHALRLKYAFNRDRLLPSFEAVGDRMIVEISNRDDFWGAKPQVDGSIYGANVLGRLCTELVREVAAVPGIYSEIMPAPRFEGAVLNGHLIGEIPVPAAGNIPTQAAFEI